MIHMVIRNSVNHFEIMMIPVKHEKAARTGRISNVFRIAGA